MRRITSRFISTALAVALAVPAFVLAPSPTVLTAATTTPEPRITHLAPTAGWTVMTNPYRADVESDGEYWVSEWTYPVVSKYDALGNQLFQLGDGVADAAGFNTGAPVNLNRFNRPAGVSADSSSGLVYVSDFNNRCIRVLRSSDGTSLASFPTSNVGGILQAADGLDVGADGGVYAAITGTAGNGGIKKYTPDGQVLISSRQLGTGTFTSKDLTVDASGVVYVVRGQGTVWRYSQSTTDSALFNGPEMFTVPGAANIQGIEIDAEGYLVATAFTAGKIFRLLRENPASVVDSWTVPTTTLQDPAITPDGELLTVDFAKRAVDRWSSAASTSTLLGHYSGASSDPGRFNYPKKSAATTDAVYVIDSGNNRIEKLTHSGAYVGSYLSGIIGATAIAAQPSGSMLVGNGAVVQSYSAEGVYSSDFSASVAVASVGDIEVAQDGRVYVADPANNAVHQFGAEGGEPIASWTAGSGGAFLLPEGVGVAPDGSVWVADTGNNQIQHIASNGILLEAESSWGSGALSVPVDAEVASDGTVWIADKGNNRVVQYCPSDTGILSWHAPSERWWASNSDAKSGVGANKFIGPEGLAITPQGRIIVSDTGAHHVMSADVVAPVTTVNGVPSSWTSRTVNATFTVSDASPVTTYGHLSQAADSLVPSGTAFSVSAEGTHTLTYHSVDSVGTREADKQVVMRIDRTAPATLTIEDLPTTWSALPTATATVLAQDAVSGIQQITYRLNDGPDSPYSGGIDITAEGVTTLTVTAYDKAGNSTVRTGVVRLDRTAPVPWVAPAGAEAIEPRPMNAGASDAGVGVATVFYSVDATTSPTAGTSFDLFCESRALESRTAWAWSVDSLGNASEAVSTTVLVSPDAQGPLGDAEIAGGSAWIATAAVTATSTVTDAYQMSIASTSTGTWGPWVAYQPTAAWMLPAEAEYTLGIRYRDRASAYHDTVDTALVVSRVLGYDSTPPQVPAIGGLRSTWASASVELTATSFDALSDIDSLQYRLGDGTFTTYAPPITVAAEGVTTVTVRATDKAGNVSESTATVRIDLTKPVTAVTPDLSTHATWSDPTQLTFSASDAHSTGVTTYHRIDSGQPTTAPAATIVGESTHTVEWWSVDAAGNVETPTVQEFTILRPDTRSMLTASASRVTYGGALALTASVAELSAAPAQGKTVWIESSPNGYSAWARIAVGTTDASGRFITHVYPSGKSYYRVSFDGDVWHKLSSSVSVPGVFVYPTITRPVTPTRVYKSKYFSAYAYLKPAHTAGAVSTKMQFFHYENRRWVLRKTVSAKNIRYNTTTSKAYARTYLSLRGSWRMRVYHPADAQHLARYSAYSRTITVK